MIEPKWLFLLPINQSTRLKMWKFPFLSFMLYNYLKLVRLLSKCLSNQHSLKISPSNTDQLCGRFNFCPQILWHTSFQEEEFNSLPFECGLDLWVASSEQSIEREKSNFAVEKPGIHHLTKWSKLTSSVVSRYHVPPDMTQWEGFFTHLWYSSPKCISPV